WTNRRFPRTHAIEEIPHMVVAVVQALGAFWQRSLNQSLITSAQVAAIYPQPAVGALETDTVSLSLRVFDAAEDVVWFGRANCVQDTVFVFEPDLVFADGGISAGNWFHQHFPFDFYWPGKPDCPKCDIIVMSAPIGHRSSRIVVPITKHGMATLRNIFD